MSLQTTTWQTVGPFFRIGLERLFQHDIAGENTAGERIFVEGRLLDHIGAPISDAVLEIWQANASGKYAHPDDTQNKTSEPGFRGFGRIPTDDAGVFRFTTVKPGIVPGPGGKAQAPHLVVSVLMRGLLKGLNTRAYFFGEESNDEDPILALVPPSRRPTLLLQPLPAASNRFQWTIRMQGEGETVFFDF